MQAKHVLLATFVKHVLLELIAFCGLEESYYVFEFCQDGYFCNLTVDRSTSNSKSNVEVSVEEQLKYHTKLSFVQLKYM